MVGARGCDEQRPLDTVALFNSCCRCWPTRTRIPDSLQNRSGTSRSETASIGVVFSASRGKSLRRRVTAAQTVSFTRPGHGIGISDEVKQYLLRLYKGLPLDDSSLCLTNRSSVKLLAFNVWVH